MARKQNANVNTDNTESNKGEEVVKTDNTPTDGDNNTDGVTGGDNGDDNTGNGDDNAQGGKKSKGPKGLPEDFKSIPDDITKAIPDGHKLTDEATPYLMGEPIEIGVAKDVGNIMVEFDRLPQSVKSYLIGYGLKQTLNDAHASIKETDYKADGDFTQEEVFKIWAKRAVWNRLCGIYMDEVGRTGFAEERLSPLDREIKRLATLIVEERLNKANIKWRGKNAAITTEEYNDMVKSMIEKRRDKLTATAQANLDMASEDDEDADDIVSSALQRSVGVGE